MFDMFEKPPAQIRELYRNIYLGIAEGGTDG